jgi:hypothetical protein
MRLGGSLKEIRRKPIVGNPDRPINILTAVTLYSLLWMAIFLSINPLNTFQRGIVLHTAPYPALNSLVDARRAIFLSKVVF